MTGVVFEVQRWSIHDGPGVRTVIFLKGCPLRCPWCCNPESQRNDPQIVVFPQKCIDCGKCIVICPMTISIPSIQGGIKDRGLCAHCGKCVEVCPAGAREWAGKEMTPKETMDIIQRDTAFYRRSGGGVTFSGGEPLGQPDFVRSLIEMSSSVGITTAIETCGHFKWETCRDILKMVDLIILDIKHINPSTHMKLTGVSNKRILQNAMNIDREKIPLIIRIPVVPSVNDSPGNIEATAEFVRRHLPNTTGIELLPYHALGKMKYEALGLKYRLEHIEPPVWEEMTRLRRVITNAGINDLCDMQSSFTTD